MHSNVCPVKRSGPGLVTEERREEEEKWHPVIRVMSWHQARHSAHTRRRTCRVFWCLSSGLFLLTEVSLSRHPVNTPLPSPDLCVTLLSWYYHHHQIQILSRVPHPVTITADDVLLTLRADTLMQRMINIYISDRYSMSSRVYFPVVSPSHRVITAQLMIRYCEEWDTPGSQAGGKKPSGSYLAFQQILTSLSQFVIQSPACWERRVGNYHRA